jgi:hypothetical protein
MPGHLYDVILQSGHAWPLVLCLRLLTVLQELEFVTCSEYAEDADVGRARAEFFSGACCVCVEGGVYLMAYGLMIPLCRPIPGPPVDGALPFLPPAAHPRHSTRVLLRTPGQCGLLRRVPESTK